MRRTLLLGAIIVVSLVLESTLLARLGDQLEHAGAPAAGRGGQLRVGVAGRPGPARLRPLLVGLPAAHRAAGRPLQPAAHPTRLPAGPRAARAPGAGADRPLVGPPCIHSRSSVPASPCSRWS